MSFLPTVYSGKDLNFTLNSPLYGQIFAAGIAGQGLVKVTVRPTETRTVIEGGMDGSAQISAISAAWGEVDLEVWQTSTFYQQLVDWFNALDNALNAGDPSNWASTTVLIQNTVSGQTSLCTGVSPKKFPDGGYEKQAKTRTWTLTCGNIASS
jgi:hypothetical protein